MPKQANYDPEAEYIVAPGASISLPPNERNPHKRFISANDVDEHGQPVRFTMSHRTAKEVQFLVERKRVILPAPAAAAGGSASKGKNSGSNETGPAS